MSRQQPEAVFRGQVQDMAEMYGWSWMHVKTSTYGERFLTAIAGPLGKGWPDLLLVKPGRRPIVVETKNRGESPDEDQRKVLMLLSECGFDCYVWWPSDLDDIPLILRSAPPLTHSLAGGVE